MYFQHKSDVPDSKIEEDKIWRPILVMNLMINDPVTNFLILNFLKKYWSWNWWPEIWRPKLVVKSLVMKFHDQLVTNSTRPKNYLKLYALCVLFLCIMHFSIFFLCIMPFLKKCMHVYAIMLCIYVMRFTTTLQKYSYL